LFQLKPFGLTSLVLFLTNSHNFSLPAIVNKKRLLIPCKNTIKPIIMAELAKNALIIFNKTLFP